MFKKFIIIALFLSMPILAWSASQSFSFSCVTKVVRGHDVYYETRWHTYHFTIEVVSDYNGTKPEYQNYRHSFIQAVPQERYSVRIHNPMPIRVAVNLMIDGLNSITGNSCTPESGHKWLIEPYSSVTVQGWQVDRESMRRFYFTSVEDSYAAWRSYQLERDVTVKCGIISAAFFWNKHEMESFFERNPIYEGPVVYRGPYAAQESKKDFAAPAGKSRSMEQYHDDRAGTGMGERRGHAIETVNFQYNTGMYSERECVRIYYDFKHHVYSRPPYYHHKRYYDDQFAPEKP